MCITLACVPEAEGFIRELIGMRTSYLAFDLRDGAVTDRCALCYGEIISGPGNFCDLFFHCCCIHVLLRGAHQQIFVMFIPHVVEVRSLVGR